MGRLNTWAGAGKRNGWNWLGGIRASLKASTDFWHTSTRVSEFFGLHWSLNKNPCKKTLGKRGLAESVLQVIQTLPAPSVQHCQVSSSIQHAEKLLGYPSSPNIMSACRSMNRKQPQPQFRQVELGGPLDAQSCRVHRVHQPRPECCSAQRQAARCSARNPFSDDKFPWKQEGVCASLHGQLQAARKALFPQGSPAFKHARTHWSPTLPRCSRSLQGALRRGPAGPPVDGRRPSRPTHTVPARAGRRTSMLPSGGRAGSRRWTVQGGLRGLDWLLLCSAASLPGC